MGCTGEKLYYKYQSKIWDLNTSKLCAQESIYTFNGKLAMYFHPPGVVNYPKGGIKKEPDDIVKNVNTWPLLMTFRMKEQNPIIDLNTYSLIGRRGNVDGRECLIIEAASTKTKTTTWIWLDPLRDFIVLRHAFLNEGTITQKIDIHYAEHHAQGWIPSGWEITWMRRMEKLYYILLSAQ